MRKYHFIGIKGAGMSSLACVLYDLGCYVQGSDVEEYFKTEDELVNRKIKIYKFNINNIQKDCIIIIGNAFSVSEEAKYAEELGCKIFGYQEFINEFMQSYKSIAVTGSHGKTTTTYLCANIFSDQKKTSYLIGDGTGKGEKYAEFFIFEACEYKRHFLSYYPDIFVFTNIDYDHPDYYKDIDDVKEAFRDASLNAKYLVANGDDKNIRDIAKGNNEIFFGIKNDNEFYADNIIYKDGIMNFDVYHNNDYLININSNLIGLHNVYNILAAIATGILNNLDINIIKKTIENSYGAKRRFEEHFFKNQILINDYAHHPKEIDVTIEAVRMKYPNKSLIVLFQPHTFTRTKSFLDKFVEVLKKADFVYLYKIFGSARENEGSISINDVCKLIDNSMVVNDSDFINLLKMEDNSVIIFMGAGITDRLMELYVQSLSNKIDKGRL